MRIGEQGSFDRVIVRGSRDGWYVSVKFAGLRVRIAFGRDYKTQFRLLRA